MQFVDIEEYEAWQKRWKNRPFARINEGKVQKVGKVEMMLVQAGAPGFRSEAVTVVHEVTEELA